MAIDNGDWQNVEPIPLVGFETPQSPRHGALSAPDFLNHEFPPRENLIAPWLPKGGLVMVYSPRGMGKTHLVVGTAISAATGIDFLNWQAKEPCHVLLIDGEMPGSLLQERIRIGLDAFGLDSAPENLKIRADANEENGLPDLSDPSQQSQYERDTAIANLIIVDNLSTICRGYRENEADSWVPVQNWLLSQRRKGKTVLMVHHANKSGGQRGTSRKEDVLDTVIQLKRPPDYQENEGARFEITFEKARGFYGDDAERIEAWFREGKWHRSSCLRGDSDKEMMDLLASDMSVRDIAERTGTSKSTVQRKKAAFNDDPKIQNN